MEMKKEFMSSAAMAKGMEKPSSEEVKKAKIDEAKFLVSGAFRSRSERFLRAITGNYKNTLEFKPNMVCTDGDKVYVDPLCPFFHELDLPGKVMGTRAQIFHEACHIHYSDFSVLKTLAAKYGEESWDGYVHKGINNLVEDAAIELAGASDFPGCVPYIQLLNGQGLKMIPTMEELEAKTAAGKGNRLTTMQFAMWEYINFGELKGALSDPELIDMLERCKPLLDEGREANVSKDRLMVSERICEVIKPLIEETRAEGEKAMAEHKKMMEELEKLKGKMDKSEKGKGKPMPKDIKDFRKDKKSEKSKGKGEKGKGEKSEGEEGEGEEGEGEGSGKEGKDKKDSSSGKGKGKGKGEEGEGEEQEGSGSGGEGKGEEGEGEEDEDGEGEGKGRDRDGTSESRRPSKSKGEPTGEYEDRDVEWMENDDLDPGDGTGETTIEKVGEMEEYDADENEELMKEIRAELEREISEVADEMGREEASRDLARSREDKVREYLSDKIDYASMHKGFKVNTYRNFEVNSRTQEQYRQASEGMRSLTRSLTRRLQNLIRFNQDEKFKGLTSGRITQSQLWRKDAKIFHLKKEKNEESELVIGMLLDESGSMGSYRRYEYARKAGIMMAEVCEALNVPFAVLGHTATFGDKTVEMRHYIEFEKPIAAQKARLMHVSARQDNRDGMAIKYTGEYLLQQPQKDKLLIVVADGQPAHGVDAYYGSRAEADCISTVENLTRRGVTCVGVAIGDGQDEIARFFENFISIPNLEKLPEKLVKLIEKRMFKD